MKTPEFNLAPVYSSGLIAERVREVAKKIDAAYGMEPVVAVCVLKGAFVFFADLVRNLSNPCLQLDFVRLSSYGSGSISSGNIVFSKDLESDIAGRHVLIVEDIVDSGNTMFFLRNEFLKRKPSSLRIAALLDKTGRREKNISVDFGCFETEDRFFVGYGLDFAEQYRGLPGIYEICDKI